MERSRDKGAQVSTLPNNPILSIAWTANFLSEPCRSGLERRHEMPTTSTSHCANSENSRTAQKSGGALESDTDARQG
jgi:hypothetical protein